LTKLEKDQRKQIIERIRKRTVTHVNLLKEKQQFKSLNWAVERTKIILKQH